MHSRGKAGDCSSDSRASDGSVGGVVTMSVTAVKQCYEGRRVHGVWPRGAMVGSGKRAGRECATTGVVGRCWNTGGRVRTGETKLNKGQGTIKLTI